MLRGKAIVGAAALAAAAVALLIVRGDGRESAPPSRPAQAAELFVDATEAAHVRFVHVNGMDGNFYFSEIIGSGVALLDYDNDDRLDLLVLQGTPLADTDTVRASNGACTARLFRNESPPGAQPGDTRFTFVDVTERARLCARGYGMAIATGDIDNDGFVDVFVTHFGAPNQLFRNNGDGTFAEVSERAGVGGDRAWGSSASFFDFDRDGFLDLYVANYVGYTTADPRKCHNYTSARDYCAPTTYEPMPDVLYRNRGNGTFEDVSAGSGITQAYGNGLGVVTADLNADGWQDIYVANDGNPNQLWINQQNGRFRDEAAIRGAAVNANGAPEAGMGIAVGDADANGTDDLLVTHLTNEKATLYVNLQDGMFADSSATAGLYAPTSPYTGFGTAFMDYDNDGLLDLVIVNGAVHLIESQVRAGDPFPLHQIKLLLRNVGNGRFEDMTSAAGPAFALSEVGRGLAAGDLDNDGRIDFVVSNNNGPLRVFHNRVAGAGKWIGLRLLSGKRDAYGARVELRRRAGPTLWRRVHTDGSYLSASDPRLLIGLGHAGQALEELVVHWPDGRRERFPAPPLGRYTTLAQGQGSAGAPR